jgi:hypothetical protein
VGLSCWLLSLLVNKGKFDFCVDFYTIKLSIFTRPGSADSQPESGQQAENVGACSTPLPTPSISPNPVEAVSSQDDANPAVRGPVARAPMGRAAAFQHLLAQR